MALDRRTFLKLGGASVVGITFVSLLDGCEQFAVTPLGNVEAPFITPNDLFFVQNGGEGSLPNWTRPNIATDAWSLRIEGFKPADLATPQTITYADLIAAAEAGQEMTIMKTIQCVLESPVRLTPTGFMGNAYWTGVPLKYFLDKAGVAATTKRLLFYGADGFTNNIKIGRVTDADADGLLQPLLVYKMNGTTLTPEHGAPVRLILQEGYGYKNVKWLTKIQATAFDVQQGTYQDQGYADDGVIRVNSRSTVMREGTVLAAGTTVISGYAVSGYAPIEKVEIAIDAGPFQAAEIVPLAEIRSTENLPASIRQIAENQAYPYRTVWASWRFRWEAPAGEHTVRIRATDTVGNAQPDGDTNIYDGQTGVTTYRVTVQ